MKKKILFAVITVCLCLLAFGALTVSAETYGDLNYEFSYGEVTITGCKTSATEVVIPAEIDGYPVTSIDYRAFYNCSKLTSVTIPDSVTSIGDRTFYNCSELTSVTIPDSVTSIGSEAFYETAYYNDKENWENGILYIGNHLIVAEKTVTSADIKPATKTIANTAFYGCTELSSVTIPDSVTYIGNQAFEGCTGLSSVTIPDSVTSIDYYAFASCTGLTSVTIPDSVTSIDGSAFYETAYYSNKENWENGILYIGNHLIVAEKTVTSADIKPATKTIANSAFDGCTGLTSVTIPDSVTTIGNGAFYNCSELTSVTIGESVTSIGREAFYGCTGLTSVTIPDSVTFIGDSAFFYCSGLTSVTIEEGVTSIGDSAFYRCTGLTSVTIGEGVTSIGSYAFEYCGSLESVRVSNAYAWFSISFSNATANPLSQNAALFVDNKLVTSITVPSGISEISPYALYNCSTLKTITIHDGVTHIGESAFDRCNKLTIICEDGSYALVYALKNNIPYNIVELSPSIVSSAASRINDKIVVFAEPSETNSYNCLHIALYSDKNAMVDYIIVPTVKTLDHINVVFKDNPSASYAKIFLWNSIQSMEPVAEAVKVEIK